MKIERLSENQIRLTLTRSDLQARDIKLEDLMKHSEKTQRLFKELMESALEEYEFIGENMPLMVEASPAGQDSIIIVVTKIGNETEEDENSVIDYDNLDSEAELEDDLETQYTSAIDEDAPWKSDEFENKDTSVDNANNSNSSISVYCFEQLDDIINLSTRISKIYSGESSVYRLDNQYFLILQGIVVKNKNTNQNLLPYILHEYGEKYISNSHSQSYLQERGETIVKENAVGIFAETF